MKEELNCNKSPLFSQGKDIKESMVNTQLLMHDLNNDYKSFSRQGLADPARAHVGSQELRMGHRIGGHLPMSKY